ncbi:ABC transporter ATP-binding protein [Bosea sp. Leaf344]|uniref:ABC transporter ATP-binding protein n=1 Tax=Bosea sp. Leaf344 TaxID=1736346 RepID=UPI0006FD5248|nr:ABC transporter ATP-binding protein [Bosea sp. Leaf344]KQU52090.1 ABC transporter ATP-binding protein [Bosea sp. Leaf344]
MVSVELRTVSKNWGGAPAVDSISFTVAQGHLVALLGPSGCGKSTTLRLIAGLEETSGGAILIGERDVTSAPPSRRGISMVFQNYALFPHLSVAENILFGLKVRHVGRAERDERLKRTADILGLAGLLDRKPSQLSGGQQQRVALGRAIVAEAPVCLMDEPLSNLDAQLRVEMRREIRELQKRLGITMVYVTHDQVEAMTMADQVVLMRAGRIEQDGPPDTLYEHPETIFVARFVGTPPMNVISWRSVLEHGAGAGLSAPPGHEPARLAVGIRPEMTELAESGIAAEVVAVEYLGADTLVETRIDGQNFIIRRPGKVKARPGERVYIGLSQNAVHWFDLQTERRLIQD